MNTDRELDDIVRHWLEDRVADPPHGGLQSALARADQTPQQHHRWLQWWYGRGGSVTGSAAAPGRSDPSDVRRTRLMFNVTAMATSVAALALIGALVIPQGTTGPDPLPAPMGTTFSVASEGGDFTTITDALAAAQDGDTVLVQPGTYEESIVIDKDITLAGGGTRPREVTIIVPADAPPLALGIAPPHEGDPDFEAPSQQAVGVHLLSTNATLRNLLVMGQADGVAMAVRGGAPILEDVIVRHSGELDPNQVLAVSLFIDGAATPTVRGGQIWHRAQVGDGSTATFEDVLLQYSLTVVRSGSHLEVEGSDVWAGDIQPISIRDGATASITETRFHDGGVDVRGEGTHAVIRGNTFSSAPIDAVLVSTGASATVTSNSFERNHTGVSVSHGDARVLDNDFLDNDLAVSLSGSDSEVIANDIRGGGMGITIVDSGEPTVRDNLVEGARTRGIVVGGGTSPTIDGNTVCGNSVNLLVQSNAEPIVADNDICPDGAAGDAA